MIGFGDAPVAFGLTRGMGRVVGVDLIRAVTEGWMSRAELDGLVDACQRCKQIALCTNWLATTPRAADLPDYCANKAGIEALRG